MDDQRFAGRRRWPLIHGMPPSVQDSIILVVLYVLAWGGLLFSSTGIYWDDWIYVSIAPDQVLQLTRELGLPWVGFLMLFLLSVGPVAYHALSLLFFLLVGMSTLAILRRVPLLTRGEGVFVAALVLVLPLMAARHVLIDQYYVLSYALFYLAWYLLVRSNPHARLSLWIAGALFAASFTTSSLLPFYLLPMAHLWYHRGHRTGMSVRSYLQCHWALLILPFAWYLAKGALFEPHGLYADYNEVVLDSLWAPTILLVLSAAPLAGLYMVRGSIGSPALGILTALLAGTFLIVLAIYPYVVVDRPPPFVEWQTRYELLMPLGVALVVLAVYRAVAATMGRGMAQLTGLAVLSSSIVLSISICMSYFVDWDKQQSLVEGFRATPALANASTVVFQDETRGLNIFGRMYRFYEWNGLMKRAFGTETRFGVNDTPKETRRLLAGGYRRHERYAARDYAGDGTVTHVTISPRDERPPWYAALPYVSRLIPDARAIVIRTTVLTVEDAFEDGSGGS